MSPGARARLRATVLTLVVLGNLLQAMPFPRKEVKDADRAEWRTSDLDMWHGWLASVGVGVEREAFRDAVIDNSNRLWAFGRTVQAPVRPVFSTLRTTQQWGLFGVVAETPEALVVEIEVDGAWRTVEQRLHPEYTWRDEVFRYRRVRGTWDGAKPDRANPLYDAFARWAAEAAFADFPEATRVRLSRHRFVVNAPWEDVEREPEVLHERIYERDRTTLWVLR